MNRHNLAKRLRVFLGIALLAMAAIGMAAAPTADRSNILFLITDQQCADAMSCRLGTRYLKTPAMDSLAQNGIVFTRAYSANPLCMPSRNSIFTGRYPHETGVTRNAPVRLDSAEFIDLGTYFRLAGYHTAYFGKRHLCFNVEDSFETAPKEPRKEHDLATVTAAVDYLSHGPKGPFLAVVSFMNPHNVCELARGEALPDGPIGAPPAPEECPPVPANLEPPVCEPDTMTILRRGYQANPMFPVGHFTPERWRQLRWGYYRLVEKVDAQVGAVLAALRRAGLEENTLVVFTSDHGECAGAHGWNQKTVFYEESARVPLVVRLPGRARPGTCAKLVNTGLDILPTLLDFAGVPVPEKLPGRSLRPLALGEPVPVWRDYVVVENNLDQAGPLGATRPTAEGRMVRTDRYKYCVYSRGRQRESLVDLETDPGENVNVAYDPQYSAVVREHRALLARFAKEHHDPLAADILAADVRPLPFAPPETAK